MKNKKIIILVTILIIICFITIIVSETNKIAENFQKTNNISENVKTDNNEKLKFDKNDSIIKDIKLGMSPENVKEIMGEPEKIEHQEISEYVLFESMTYYYNDLIIIFNKSTNEGGLELTEAQITGPSLKLVNGLSVGSSYNEVINSYYNDKQERKYEDELSKEEWAMFLYGDYLYTYSQNYTLPEKYEQTGYVDLESNCISYVCYEKSNEECLEYTKLRFYLNDKNEVTNINWGKYKQV